VHEALASGWDTQDARFGMIAAATGHAMAFSTWQSLVREQGLADEDAVEVMVALVRCLSPSRAE
jgi:hypothetical protein